jgi:hypothetical protein
LVVAPQNSLQIGALGPPVGPGGDRDTTWLLFQIKADTSAPKQISEEFSKVSGSAKKPGEDIETAGKKANGDNDTKQSAGGLGGMLKSLGLDGACSIFKLGAAFGLGTTTVGVFTQAVRAAQDALVGFLKAGIDFNAMVGVQSAAVGTLFGSRETSDSRMKDLVEFASTTPSRLARGCGWSVTSPRH